MNKTAWLATIAHYYWSAYRNAFFLLNSDGFSLVRLVASYQLHGRMINSVLITAATAGCSTTA
jgi:hypothetical protein